MSPYHESHSLRRAAQHDPDAYAQMLRENRRFTRRLGLAILATLLVLGGGIAFWSACATVPQGEVGFVKGGGPLDGARKKIKGDLVNPGLHITGTWDGMDTYPAYRTVRFQDFDVSVTTLDGKKVQVQGQVGFRFIGEKDPAEAREFATGLGSRKYGGKRPGDGGGEGWTKFLDQLVTPEVNAVFKDQFGRVYCADFEPSCRAIDPRRDIPVSNPERVYSTIAPVVQRQVAQKLGGGYLTDFRVRVRRISLPKEVQTNIDRVTTEQARTQASKQAVKTAAADAESIRIRGRALKANKGLIGLEIAKECKGGDQCTLIVDGTGDGVASAVRAGK
ncbi:SPFH domain-containing protein [Patulibacter sp. SYSU D01012]|uniref:SPFH domain-containing protein n=1 Tax=Patulibacter sp. SYSU D01012 TaxID=2817381 RepID=UPI001B309AAE|nr:SPFH domain-containing protein [Patulibacter sp. SYSU D01012]